MKGFVQTATNHVSATGSRQHPAERRSIIEKCKLAAQGRIAARKARS